MLRRRPLGEADEIISFLSPAEGQFQAVARSSRKPSSSMVGKLEPSSHLQAQFARGRSLDRITQARMRGSFPRIRESLERLARGSYLLELFRSCVPYREESRGTFRLLLACLEGLDSGWQPDIVCRWTELQLLGQLGYEPQLDGCVLCGRPDELEAFSPSAGGAVCRGCTSQAVRHLPMLPAVLGSLRFLRRSRLEAAHRLKLQPEQARRLSGLLGAHFQEHWPTRPDPGKMLKAWGVEVG